MSKNERAELLEGDLDNIVLMALRKEPQRRYGSVEQMSTDIQRYLADLPVSASADTLRYRASKFVRRHRAAVVAGVAIAFVLFAGMGATLYEAHIARMQEIRAEKRFNELRKIANSLMFEIYDSVHDLPGSTSARKLLVDRALQYLDSLSTESGNDPSLLRELAFAYERVGDVQGYFFSGNLGDTAGAMRSYQRALAIREVLARNNPKDRATQADLAKSYYKLADVLYTTGDQAAALQKTRQVVAIRQALAVSDPTSDTAQRELASANVSLGDALIEVSDWAGARQAYESAHSAFEKLSSAHPDVAEYHRMIAVVLGKIGFLHERTGELKLASEDYQQALFILRELLSNNPTNTRLLRNLAVTYLDIGDVALALGDPKGITDLTEAAKVSESISAQDPSNRRIDRDISLIYAHLGDAEKKNGKLKLALEYYSKGLAAAKRRAASDPQNVDAAEALANRYQNLGIYYASMAGSPEIAAYKRRELWQDARSSYQKSLGYWLDPGRKTPLSKENARTVEDLQRRLHESEAALKTNVSQN